MENEKNYVNVTREKTKRVEVLLKPEVYDALRTKAIAEGLTMTSVIKLALKEFLNK